MTTSVTVEPLPAHDLDAELVCEVAERCTALYTLIANEPECDGMLTCARHLNQAVKRVGGYRWNSR